MGFVGAQGLAPRRPVSKMQRRGKSRKQIGLDSSDLFFLRQFTPCFCILVSMHSCIGLYRKNRDKGREKKYD